jgi:hypothetical protein
MEKMRKKTMALLLQKTPAQSPPSISNSRKRGSSTTDTTSSPSKIPASKKVLVNVIMQGLVSPLEIATDKEVSALKEIAQTKKGEASQAKQARVDDVQRCLNMVVEARADKGSVEYYVATICSEAATTG